MKKDNKSYVQPRIAIIMSVYNEHPQWLRESIESILNQTWSNLHFYITLDDPNNINLQNILKEYAALDSRISVFQNNKNMGLVKSLNKLLDLTSETYIARMDADDISIPYRIEREFAFLKNNNLDFVMSGINLLSEEGELAPGRSLPDLDTKSLEEIQKYTNVSIHPTWLLKAEVYENLRGYRDIDYCEDLDFVLRAIQHGYKIGRMSEPLLNYRFRDSSISHSNAFIQSNNTHLLQNYYSKGLDLELNNITSLLKSSSEHNSASDYRKSTSAKKNMSIFTESLYRGEWISCIRIALPNLLLNNQFRCEFIKALKARYVISKITKNKPD